MKKAATLIFLSLFAGLQGWAQQPTASNYTMPVQQYSATQYITVPANAFSGVAAAGTYLSYFVLPNFPTNASRLQVTPEGGPTTTYSTNGAPSTTMFPAGGIFLGVTTQGRPRGVIKILPNNPGSTTTTIQLNYQLYGTNNNNVGSYLSIVACIFIPVQTTPLNVTLAQFGGEAKDAATQLTWTTQSEDNLRGFDVEWSVNLGEWKSVGHVASSGAGNVYEWRHESPAQGANYYRVRTVSQSGASSVSTVVKVNHGASAVSVTATPNPTQDFLRIEAPAGSFASLIDLGGKEVGRLQLSAASTMNVQHLASGMYQLTIRSAAGNVLAQERIVKQ